MPFGLKNVGQSFQRMMDRTLGDSAAVFGYMDDVLIATAAMDQHVAALTLVLGKLREMGLVLNIEKCEFGRPKVEFLGHMISSAGAEPIHRHLEAISAAKRPVDRQQLQRFLVVSSQQQHSS